MMDQYNFPLTLKLPPHPLMLSYCTVAHVGGWMLLVWVLVADQKQLSGLRGVGSTVKYYIILFIFDCKVWTAWSIPPLPMYVIAHRKLVCSHLKQIIIMKQRKKTLNKQPCMLHLQFSNLVSSLHAAEMHDHIAGLNNAIHHISQCPFYSVLCCL